MSEEKKFATDKQKKFLHNLGVKYASDTSLQEAKALIEEALQSQGGAPRKPAQGSTISLPQSRPDTTHAIMVQVAAKGAIDLVCAGKVDLAQLKVTARSLLTMMKEMVNE